MTSGDGERPSAADRSADVPAASAAELCLDSDDLLTTRRGGLPPVRSQVGNGHVAAADSAPEHSFSSGVEMAAPGEIDIPRSDTVVVEETDAALLIAEAPRDEPAISVHAPPAGEASATAPDPSLKSDVVPLEQPLTDTMPSAVDATAEHDAAVMVPPPTVEEPASEPIAAGPPMVEEALPLPMATTPTLAEVVQEPAVPLPPLDEARTDDAAVEATYTSHSEATPGIDAFQAQSEPERDVSPGTAGPTGGNGTPVLTAPEPAVADQSAPWHTAGTAEFPVVEHPLPDDRANGFVSAPVPSDLHAVNDIEIPVPVAATEAANSAAYSPPLDEADAGIGRDQVATHVGETIELPLSQWETEPAVLASADIPAPPSIEPPAPPLAATPPPPPAAPPPGDDEEAGATMTIIEHLEELRHRVTISAISVVVGAVIGWFIVPHVVQYLEDGARNLGGKFFSPTILGPFGLELKLSFLIGLIISSPMVLYQIWGFIAPGLTRRERRYALPFSLIGGALFAGGAVTGVLIVPLAIRFLIHFFSVLDLEQLLDIDKYIMFIALIAVIFGITFELPIFMVGFSLLGVVNSRFFIQKFRIAIFVIYGVSMVITPGADLISPLVLGTFLIVLYWLGVLLIRVIGR